MRTLEVATFPSPIGPLGLAAEDGVLVAVTFNGLPRLRSWATRALGRCDWVDVDDPAGVTAPLERFFAGDLDALASIPVRLHGTDFQRRTWKLRTLLEQCPEKETIAALQWLAGHPDAPLHPSFVAYLAQPAPPDAAPAARLPTPEELVAQWTGPFNRLWKRVKADPLRPQCA